MAGKISHYRNEETGELAPPHRLGTTAGGAPLYLFLEGREPVDEDGRPVPCLCDEDGNWSPLDEGDVERVWWQAYADAALFMEEFGEPLDPARTDWDTVAWGEFVRDLGLSHEKADALWPYYQAELVAETERLCAD